MAWILFYAFLSFFQQHSHKFCSWIFPIEDCLKKLKGKRINPYFFLPYIKPNEHIRPAASALQ